MEHIHYLFAANVVVWLGIGAYAAFLGLNQRKLHERCKHLELTRDDAE
jgi:CcmD family protein